jgi:hypothetical protein
VKTCLVTTTFYPSIEDIRFKLAQQTIFKARTNGYPLFIVDGSSSLAVRSGLMSHDARVLQQTEPGMGGSRRQVLRAALEQEFDIIVWLEPEKHPLVPLLPSCILPVMNGTCDMIVPYRFSFKNYPMYQAESERRANQEIAEITGRPDLDLMIGPRIMNRQMAKLMLAYDGTLGDGTPGDNWEILFIPVLRALSQGMHVGSVTVDYIHPPEQLIEDDVAMRTKRDVQRENLVRGMRAEAESIGWNTALVA